MMIVSIIVLTICCTIAVPVDSNEIVPNRYTVNLDLEPAIRWNDVLSHFKDYVLLLHKVLNELIPKELVPLLEFIAGSIHTYLPETYAQEIEGIAKYLNVSVGSIVLPNIIYDVSAFYHANEEQKPRGFCTSIVAEDKNGEIIHGRNLDYPIITDLLEKITVELDFIKGGEVLYTTTQYLGHVGVHTGQKPHMFTVSMNERDTGNVLENALMAILDRAALVSFLVRDTLETANSYAETVSRLNNTDIIAPVYYIVGGIKSGQGVVITRDRKSAVDVWPLQAASGRWYVLETNYDHWKPAPSKDNRRADGNRAMQSVGQGHINNSTLFKVLSTPRVLNAITTYTTLMSANRPGLFSTWVRGG